MQFIDADNVVSLSDVGKMQVNEDKFFNLKLPTSYFASIFDGIGGGATGELSAQICIDAISRELKTYEYRKTKQGILQAFKEANRMLLLRKTKLSTDNNNACASACGILIRDREVCIANIGNCRAYLIRQTAIQQITKEHTYLQELIDNGIAPNEDEISNKKHLLTRMLGGSANIDISSFPLWIWDSKDCDVECDDLILICTDGLYEYVSKDEIVKKINEIGQDYKLITKELVKLAIANGSQDNISLTIIPLNGQLKNAMPPGYKEVEENIYGTEEFDDDNYEDQSENRIKDIDNIIYFLHMFILMILFNFISFMSFLVSLK